MLKKEEIQRRVQYVKNHKDMKQAELAKKLKTSIRNVRYYQQKAGIIDSFKDIVTVDLSKEMGLFNIDKEARQFGYIY